jgi:hypothetical protein
MSCFDMLICDLALLGEASQSNSLTEDMFQFKEFGCNTSTYEIDELKQLVLKIDHSNGVDKDLHVGYTGELELVGRAQSYIATFKDGVFIKAEKYDD